MLCSLATELIKPNTHLRRDTTRRLSRVGGVYGIRSWRQSLSTSLNKFANSAVELRRLGGVSTTRPSEFTIFCICVLLRYSD